MRLCILITAFATALAGQEFEVVSIKPNKSLSNGSDVSSGQGMLTASLSLKDLIVDAYGLRDYQIEGPAWLDSERFDIAAKFPEGLSKDPQKYNEQLSVMMQKMLADRFRLAVHRDSKNFAVYGLVVAKGGIKFKEVPDSSLHHSSGKNTHYTGKGISMATLAGFLSPRMDLPVVDMTSLKGFYDITLEWAPEPKSSPENKDANADPTVPTLPLALQEQLGLKLENRKAAIEILIVDHAEKTPTDN